MPADARPEATRSWPTAAYTTDVAAGISRCLIGVDVEAIIIETDTAPARLLVRDIPDPVPDPADLIVEVRASALNRADLRRAASHFAGSESREGPTVGGLEMAGVVAAVGHEVRGFTVGDRVMAMTGGAWAERVRVDHRLVLPVPTGFTWAQAAATPVSFVTAHDALASAARLAPGESVLVRGASSAAGIAAVQVARALGSGPVYGTTNSAAKVPLLERLGCVGIVSGEDGVASLIRELTGGAGVEIVIDIVGAGAVQDNIDAAAIAGRIVCLGRLAGFDGRFNLDEFARKRIHMIGVTFRTRTLAERISAVTRFRKEMLPSFSSGELQPVIDRAFPFREIEEAQQYMQNNFNFGKVIIEMGRPEERRERGMSAPEEPIQACEHDG
jgi:NADPH2:quinone reductase